MPAYDSEPGLSLGFNFDDGNAFVDPYTPSSAVGARDDFADAESNADDYEDASFGLAPEGSNNDIDQTSRGASLAVGTDIDAQSQGSSLTRGNRCRANGETFAEGRPITADMDSTDEMIVNLKDSGYTNEQVAKQLAREGRVNYDKKTVGSRYLRLKTAIVEREEERLDDELTDWHEGEDEALLKANQLAQNEIKDSIARAKSRRWHIVAKNLHKILKKELKYSPGACQKRFIALQNDTATIPPELDDDQVKRAEEKASRVLAKLHARNLREATDRQAKEQKRLAIENEKLKKALEKKDRADKRAQVAQENAKLAMLQAAKREQKATELAAAREAHEAQIHILRNGGGNSNISTSRAKATPKVTTKRQSSMPITPATSDMTPSTGRSRRSAVSELVGELVDSPRSRLSLKELENLCVKRGLSKNGSKTILMKRLAQDDSTMSVMSLQTKLQERNVSIEGTKAQLIARLTSSDVAESAWGKKNTPTLNNFWDITPTSVKRAASPERAASQSKRVCSSEYTNGGNNLGEGNPPALMGLAATVVAAGTITWTSNPANCESQVSGASYTAIDNLENTFLNFETETADADI